MVPRPLEIGEAQGAPVSSPKFLIVRFSAIGDCVMTLPAVSAIRRTYPDSLICWAVEKRCADVIDTEKLVSLRYEADRHTWRKSRWSMQTWRDQSRFYIGLRQHRFDIGIDFQGHSKTAICLRLANPKVRLAERGEDPLSRALNPCWGPPINTMHRVVSHSKTLRSIGEFCEDETPMLPDLTSEKAKVLGIAGKEKPLATITVGAGTPMKVVPQDNWKVVAKHLLAQGYRVLFLGGPGDKPIEVEGTIDCVGKFTIRETMAAVAQSAIHVCGDTGTGHMAAACDVPVVCVFGHELPEIFRPYTDKLITLKEGNLASNVKPDQIVAAIDQMRERYGI